LWTRVGFGENIPRKIWQESKHRYTGHNMVLFIDPISENITLTILENDNPIEYFTIKKWDDFSTFPEKVVEVVDLYSLTEIWCICGPGAFTRMRIVTLSINTLALSRWIKLKWCHFFDLIEWGYTPILRANDREYITRIWGRDTLIDKTSLLPGKYYWYGDQNDFTDDKVLIQYDRKYAQVSDIFEKISASYHLSPLYLKDPHITWSKKNTSPF
jgi:tRNA A37 threonylcarbamoyladenosine modification protein TsaB